MLRLWTKDTGFGIEFDISIMCIVLNISERYIQLYIIHKSINHSNVN